MEQEELATPNLQDAIATDEATHQEDEAQQTEEQPTSKQDEANSSEEPSSVDEYDKVWDSDEDINSIDIQPKEKPLDEPTVGSEEQEPVDDKPIDGVIVSKPLKYKGNEIYVKNEDEAITLMQKGLDYEFKMSRIKPFRKAIKVMDENGLTDEDIQALADAKSGNSEALSYLSDKFNIEPIQKNDDDLFGSDEPKQDNNYKPEVDTTNDNDVVEYFKEYSQSNPEQANLVLNKYNSIEPAFQLEVTQNTQLFKGFRDDVLNGTFDKLYPEVLKVKAVNPNINWIQAYVGVAQQILKPTETKEPTEQVQKKQGTKTRKAERQANSYDNAWDDEDSFKSFEQELFG